MNIHTVVIVSTLLSSCIHAGQPATDSDIWCGCRNGGNEVAAATFPTTTALRPRDGKALRLGLLMVKELNIANPPARDGSYLRYMIDHASRWPSEFPRVAGNRELHVEIVEIGTADPKVDDYDLLVLMPEWAYFGQLTSALDAHAQTFHDFVSKGGGILVFQPNPMDNYPARPFPNAIAGEKLIDRGYCSPAILPLPAVFYNWYVSGDIGEKIDVNHPITQGLDDSQMPFACDRILELSSRYTVLARGQPSNSPSLAVASYGKGRIVLLPDNIVGDQRTAVRKPSKTIERRSILWASRCCDEEVASVGENAREE